MSTLLSGAALMVALGGCGADEAPSTDPGPTAPTASSEPAEPTTGTPSESAEPTEPADPTTQAPTATEDQPDGDLPTSATAYADAFIQAWRGGDPAEMEQFATDDAIHALAGFTPWGGAEWLHVSNEPVDGAEISGTMVHYRTADNQLLTISVDNAIVEAGGERAVLMADYSLGDYPVPDTVDDYAQAFLSAVGTDDTEFALRLGPVDGFASTELWSHLTYGMIDVSDAGDGEALVTVPFQEGGELQLTIAVAAAEDAQPHAITSVVFVE
ncbi:hypothetical protein [Ornithinimicrobium ciconiae]|nr:hypothetical protein [Ornithinimicrobium ciconiae]